VQVGVIKDYQMMLQKMSHMKIFFSDCVHVKPNLVRTRNLKLSKPPSIFVSTL